MQQHSKKCINLILWAKSLKINDKVDIKIKSTSKWHVGTIKSINDHGNCLIFLLDYNKFEHDNNDCITSHYSESINIPTQTSSIAKLHTYTPCNSCKKIGCLRLFGKTGHYWSTKCKDCEFRLTTQAIEDCNIDMLYYDIIMIIAQYCIGYNIDCSNTKCCNKIIIKSGGDFWSNKNAYFYYDIHPEYLRNGRNDIEDRYNLIKIYGAYRRFFCGFCDTKKCGFCCQNSDVLPICLNHPSCSICLNQFGRKKYLNFCRNCGSNFCDKLGCGSEIFCKICAILEEQNDISKAILNAFKCNENMKNCLDMNIVNVIAEYSIGFVVECNRSECNQEIVVKSKFEFKYLSRKKFVYYSPKQIKSFKANEITSVYGEHLRLFCSNCENKRLVTKCKYGGYRGQCNNIDSKGICGDHSTCSECNGITSKICAICKRYCCKKPNCRYKENCKTCIQQRMSDDHKRCIKLKGDSVWRDNLIVCKKCNKYCCKRKICSSNGECKTCQGKLIKN